MKTMLFLVCLSALILIGMIIGYVFTVYRVKSAIYKREKGKKTIITEDLEYVYFQAFTDGYLSHCYHTEYEQYNNPYWKALHKD